MEDTLFSKFPSRGSHYQLRACSAGGVVTSDAVNSTPRVEVTWTPPSGTEMSHSLIFKAPQADEWTAVLCLLL